VLKTLNTTSSKAKIKPVNIGYYEAIELSNSILVTPFRAAQPHQEYN